MKNLLNVALAASGRPSEVAEKIGSQVTAIAGADGPIIGAVRQFIDTKIKGTSEDDTISVTATVTIDVHDIPATVTARQEAEREAHAKEVRALTAEIDALKEARKPKVELQPTAEQPQGS